MTGTYRVVGYPGEWLLRPDQRVYVSHKNDTEKQLILVRFVRVSKWDGTRCTITKDGATAEVSAHHLFPTEEAFIRTKIMELGCWLNQNK